jgi:hypothetical protein
LEDTSRLQFDDASRLQDDASRLAVECSGEKSENSNSNISFSGIFPKSETKNRRGESCKDISNTSKVWGEHLNKKISTQLPVAINHKFAGKLDFSSDKSSTRTSMKKSKKKNRLENKSHSFFGSLGCGDDSTLIGDLSQSSFLDATQGDDSLMAATTITSTAVDDLPTAVDDLPTRAVKTIEFDESDSIDLIPLTMKVKTTTEVAIKKPNQNHERKIDSSWLKRCAALEDSEEAPTLTNKIPTGSTSLTPPKTDSSSITPPKHTTTGISSTVDHLDEDDHDDIIVATPKKVDQVPKLLSSVSIPTNFKGLFGANKIGRI